MGFVGSTKKDKYNKLSNSYIKFESGIEFLKNKKQGEIGNNLLYNMDEYIGPLHLAKTDIQQQIYNIIESSKILNEDHYQNSIPNDLKYTKKDINSIIIMNDTKTKIRDFFSSLEITINENRLNKIKIFFLEFNSADDFGGKASYDNNIIINYTGWKFLNYNERIKLLIHEFMHIISNIFLLYDVKYVEQKNINGKTEYNVQNINTSNQSGFSKSFLDGEGYGEFFNEGITDLITYIILTKNNIKKSNRVGYIFNINFCDRLIEYIAEKKSIGYEELLKKIIKNYIRGNLYFLKELEDIMGKEIGKSIMKDQGQLLSQNQGNMEKGKIFDMIPSLSQKDLSKNIVPSQGLLDFIYGEQ